MLKRRKRGWKKPFSGFDPNADHRTYERPPAKDVPEQALLKPIIDKTLTACARDNKRAFLPHARDGGPRATYVIHPSQAGGCRRKAFFGFIHAPKDRKPPDPRLQRIFDVGHEGHRRIQGYVFEAWKRGIGGVTGVWEDVQLEIPELCIRGELDQIFELHGDSQYLNEIKTSAKGAYERTKVAKQEWVWQSHIYMKGVGLKAGIVYVECKDNCYSKEFWVPFDDDTWSTIEGACIQMIEHARDHKVMDDRETAMCMFCDYQGACKNNGKDIDWGKVDERVRLPIWAK
jgi:hypothetical protein